MVQAPFGETTSPKRAGPGLFVGVDEAGVFLFVGADQADEFFTQDFLQICRFDKVGPV